VVVENVASQGDLDRAGFAEAVKLAAGEVLIAFRETIVDGGMEGVRHCDLI